MSAPNPFQRAPFIVFWEVTQACDLACLHCRACAVPNPDPSELSLDEGRALLDEIHAMGTRVVVLTGGDPAKREDLLALVRHGSDIGLHMALTPSATPLVTRALVHELAEAGLSRIAISLDGADAATHDAFRGVRGSFDRTFDILGWAREVGLSTQINTTIVPRNEAQLETLAETLGAEGIHLWAVFFVVPTGRATALDALDADETEAVLERLAEIAERAPFDIKTTAAPHYRRVLLQRKVHKRDVIGVAAGHRRRQSVPTDDIGRARRGVNDGQGVAFVSHRGDVYPSGFLPIACGNVRDGGLTRAYRAHPLMNALRVPDEYDGKCGACEFRKVCGGSRARAYALTGSPTGSDPMCAYVPRAYAPPG